MFRALPTRFALLLVFLALSPVWSQSHPFTEDQLLNLCRNIKALGEDQVVDMIQQRGVDFTVREAFLRQLRKAGAGDATVKAVTTASEERMKQLRSAPAIGSPEAEAARAAQNAQKDVIAPPPLDEKGQREFIERARERAMDYTKSLPAFLCLQVTKREVALQGKDQWHTMDTIAVRLSYSEDHHEDYKTITVNNQMTDKSMDALGGAISMGEFGSLLSSVFDPKMDAQFDWIRQGALRGRAVEVYAYSVRQERSQWQISYDKKFHTYPAYEGNIWIDRETAETLRLSMKAVNIEKDFPVRSAATMLDYDHATISGVSYLLPSHSLMQMSDGQYVSRNAIDFRKYQKFSAEATITFEGEDSKDSKDNTIPPPVKKKP